MIPKTLQALIEDLQKLPSIGAKSAERLALHIATQLDQESVMMFSKHLEAVLSLKTCDICHMISDETICPICQDAQRDKRILMVVSDSKDVFVMEKMNTYHGQYHVLGGLIDFSRGIGPEALYLDDLKDKAQAIDEIILATNGTVEGEITAQFLKNYLEETHVKISRLAYGLPVGTDLKYADEKTLSKAVENRQTF